MKTQKDLVCYLCGEALNSLSEQRRDGPGPVFFCPACDLGSIIPSVVGEELKAYYDGEYRRQHGPALGRASSPQEIFETYQGFQGPRIDFIKPYLTPTSRVLDVGCSAGQFIYHLKGRVGEIVGIDYDEAAASHAAKVSQGRTYTTDLEKTDLPHSHFDLICLLQTLHHVPDPKGLLESLKPYLAPGGRIWIEVPNLHTALRDLYEIPAYRPFHFHREHYFYFSGPSLEKLAKEAGLNGKITYMQDYNFLNHLHWIYKDKPQASCEPGLQPPQLPLLENTPSVVRDELMRWAADTDQKYKTILEKSGLASNVVFLGQL